MLIQTTNELINFIDDIGVPPYVAIDTEFITEKTYYPQLCLVQIAHGSHAAVIDPMGGLDLKPLITFLENRDIIKVLHAAHQDLAIFWNDFRLAPEPVFDTQIAAMVCGFGDQVSYGQLVKKFTNTRLDKNSQIIDWSKRPLLGRHIEYALADVWHLGPVYEKLLEAIKGQNRISWIKAEMRELSDPKRYMFNPEAQVRKQKMRSLRPRQLALLHELIRWREDLAKSQNIPRGWALKDLTLRDIISNPPQNVKELGRIRGIGGLANGHTGREILERVRTAKNLPLSECPPVETIETRDQAKDSTMVLLRALLKYVSEKNGVASKLLVSKSELEAIALGGTNRASQGWRGELFGDLASQLLKGQIALTLEDGQFEIVKRS